MSAQYSSAKYPAICDIATLTFRTKQLFWAEHQSKDEEQSRTVDTSLVSIL
jgi:hypothetical protein